MTATQRQQAVDYLKSRHISERRACRLVGLRRLAMWRELQGRNDDELRSPLKALAERYPRYGCSTLHEMLRARGYVVNHKHAERIYIDERLQIENENHARQVDLLKGLELEVCV